MNGKGSKSRPLSISYEKYADNWDNIFKKKKYIVPVQETPDGEQYIELSDEILNEAGWKEGDEIEWKTEKNGFSLKKKA